MVFEPKGFNEVSNGDLEEKSEISEKVNPEDSFEPSPEFNGSSEDGFGRGKEVVDSQEVNIEVPHRLVPLIHHLVVNFQAPES